MVENAGTLVHLLEVIAVSAKYLALSVLRASRAIPEFPSFPVGRLALILIPISLPRAYNTI